MIRREIFKRCCVCGKTKSQNKMFKDICDDCTKIIKKICSGCKTKKIDNKVLLFNEDALKVLHKLPDKSVDLVLVDLPYGTTSCKWDSIIPLDKMWKELNRICKVNSAMVFTAQQPFTWKLCASNPEDFKYELIWSKPNATNPFRAKYAPMKKHENILIFYKKQPVYNPQMETGKPYKWNSRRSGGEAANILQKKDTPINNTGTRYPSSILPIKQERGLHPTQKPVELMEWLIKTYSNEGQTVIDFTMGSGTTGVAALKNNRKFIGVEMDEKYFDTAVSRMEDLEC